LDEAVSLVSRLLDQSVGIRVGATSQSPLVWARNGWKMEGRMALDFPERVIQVALLDCLPMSEHLDRVNARIATAWWHWFVFAQPDVPGRVNTADPDPDA